MKSVADALAEKIAARGITQKAAADEIGASESNLSRWLGGAVPEPPNEEGICRFLGITEKGYSMLFLETTRRKWATRRH
jgi:transcriptional regulator with XRE-family HTH domain